VRKGRRTEPAAWRFGAFGQEHAFRRDRLIAAPPVLAGAHANGKTIGFFAICATWS
jgi:hypothetical protein